MVKYENECVGCPPEWGCMGSACPKRRVKVTYCDCCGEEIDRGEVYEVDGEDLCESCLKDKFRKEDEP